MIRFDFDREKGIASALYVCKRLIGAKHSPNLHKIFKIFYFADQKHIASYGRPIVGDSYVAMKYGPVPTNLYSIFQSVRGDADCFSSEAYRAFFKVKGHNVSPLADPDLDELSESEIECLDSSIEENKTKDFDELTELSHDLAYENAGQNCDISFRDIAKVAGASQSTIAYMQEISESRGILRDACNSR